MKMKKRILFIIIPPLALLHLALHFLIVCLILSFCLRTVSVPTDKIEEDRRISSVLSDKVYYFPDDSILDGTTWQINSCRYYPQWMYFDSMYIHLAADHIEPEVYVQMLSDASDILNESTEKDGKTIFYSSETRKSMDRLFDGEAYDGCLCFFAFAVFDENSRSAEIWICSREDSLTHDEEGFTNFVKQYFASNPAGTLTTAERCFLQMLILVKDKMRLEKIQCL